MNQVFLMTCGRLCAVLWPGANQRRKGGGKIEGYVFRFVICLSLTIFSFLSTACFSEPKGGGGPPPNPFGTTVYPTEYHTLCQVRTDVIGETLEDGTEVYLPDPEALFNPTCSGSKDASAGGYTVQTSSSFNTSYSLNTDTSVLTGSFTSNGMASASGNTTAEGFCSGLSVTALDVSFIVESSPATLEISGNLSATANDQISEVGFFPITSTLVSMVIPGGDNISEGTTVNDSEATQSISVQRQLPPGQYTLRLFSRVEVDLPTDPGTQRTGSGSYNMSVNVTITGEPPGGEIFWTADDGNFNVFGNWEPPQEPGAGDTVVFDRDAIYTVTIPPTSTDRALFERGIVTFSGGPYNLTGTSAAAPSLVVGNSAADSSILFLESMQLTSLNATLGLGAGTNGILHNIEGSGWRVDNVLVVGESGTGVLNISEDSPVAAGFTLIGGEASGVGRIEVNGESTDTNTPLETGNLSVGHRGNGTLKIIDAKVTSGGTFVGNLPGSVGVVEITGPTGNSEWNVTGNLGIGDQGAGTLNLREESRIDCTNSSAATQQGGVATIVIDHSVWNINETISLGAYDDIGETAIGTAVVTLFSGLIDGAVNFNLAKESRIQGIGTVSALTASIQGTIAPSILEQFKKEGTKGPTGNGTLTFDGDVHFSGATIVVQAGGLGEGEFDTIEVTGSADLQNTLVQFSFVDGFLPRMGDQVAFLIADGTTSVTNLTTIFEGVAEGFMFDVMEENGMLMFKALNDAQPEGGEPTPVPTALNPAADVNGDKVIDADDLIEVMRNWYRVVTQ